MRKSGAIIEDFKVVSNTPYLVDEFRFPNHPGITHYFLSHFHGDHYGGLADDWCGGLIYSGEVTLKMVRAFLGVEDRWCRTLPFDKQVSLGEDRFVTLYDAFHCPGAAIFVFDLPPQGFDRRRRFVIHTGDFRYNSVQMLPWIEELKRQNDTHYIESIYLDTTYCRPGFTFPPQAEVLERIKMIVSDQISLPGLTAFVVPTYNIGKEKVLQAVCAAASSSAFVDERKMQRLQLVDLPFLDIYSTKTPQCVFVSDWMSLGTSPGDLFNKTEEVWARLNNKLSQLVAKHSIPFSRLVTIIPTGWTWTKAYQANWSKCNLEPSLFNDTRTLLVFRVPYSEHSSFSELQEFVQTMRPRKIIPTVGSKQTRDKQLSYFTNLIDRAAADKEAFLQLFKPVAKKPMKEEKPEVEEVSGGSEDYEDSNVCLMMDLNGDLKAVEPDDGCSCPPSVVELSPRKRSLKQKTLTDFLVKKARH